MGCVDNYITGDSQDAHRQVYGEEHHKSSLTHEIIAGAAGFEAMKSYENHVRRTGEQPSHPMMKEMLAGFAAAEADKLIETKGLDYMDAEKVRHQARAQAHRLAEEKYQGGTGYDQIMNDGNGYDNNYGGNRDYNDYGNQPGYDQGYGRQEGYRQEGYREDGYRQDGYREDGYRQDGYREDGYRQDGYREDGYRQDGYRGYDNEPRGW